MILVSFFENEDDLRLVQFYWGRCSIQKTFNRFSNNCSWSVFISLYISIGTPSGPGASPRLSFFMAHTISSIVMSVVGIPNSSVMMLLGLGFSVGAGVCSVFPQLVVCLGIPPMRLLFLQRGRVCPQSFSCRGGSGRMVAEDMFFPFIDLGCPSL